MNERYKDTDLREALRRKYADTPKLPADFMTKMRQQTEPEPARRVMLWRWVAAAACLIIIIGIGVTIASYDRMTMDEKLMAKQVKSEPAGTSATVYPKETTSLPSLNSQYRLAVLSFSRRQRLRKVMRKSQRSLLLIPSQ